MQSTSAKKFDTARANEYAQQSRIALAGYDACHDLAACMLAASLGQSRSAKVLVVGAGGTAQEIIAMGALEPGWTFTAVDPSAPMLEAATQQLQANDLLRRTQVHLGQVEDLPEDESFDAATLIGVLHHLPGDAAKQQILRAVQARLKPGASAQEVQARLGKILQVPILRTPRRRFSSCWMTPGLVRRHGFSVVFSGAPG